MMKKKKRGACVEKGIGYIRIQTKVKKGAVAEWYTTKFGFASIYTMAELKKTAEKLKEVVVSSIRKEIPEADKVTASAKIFHTECEYIIPPESTPKQ